MRTTEKAAGCSSLNLLVLVRFFERYGGLQSPAFALYTDLQDLILQLRYLRLNQAHPCEMSDHLDSGLSAYTDNGCGHVFLRVSRLRRRTLTWRGLARSLPSRVRSESRRVGPRSVLAYGLYFLTRLLLFCRFSYALAYTRPDFSVLAYPIYIRLVWVPAHQSSDPNHEYPGGLISDTGPHKPYGCPAHT